MQTARAWSAAAAYADADPGAAAAVARCEERLRRLHPYAMARYDRLRDEGAGLFDAMRDVLPLFARAPHARPGDPARERPLLAGAASPGGSRAYGGRGQDPAPEHPFGPGVGFSADSSAAESAARDAVRLAGECFPLPAGDAVQGEQAACGKAGRVSARSHLVPPVGQVVSCNVGGPPARAPMFSRLLDPVLMGKCFGTSGLARIVPMRCVSGTVLPMRTDTAQCPQGMPHPPGAPCHRRCRWPEWRRPG